MSHLTERLGSFGGPYKWLIWRFVSAHADLVSAPPGGHWAHVDGFAAGTWSLATTKTAAVLSIHPFGTLARSDRAAAIAEAVASFMAPDAKVHGARVG